MPRLPLFATAAALCAVPLLAGAQMSSGPAPAVAMPGAGNPESPPTAGATSSDQTGAGKKAKAAKASKASAADTSGAASTGTAANTSATAPALSTGMTVKDNTGAAIGTISKLDTGASGSVATIKMGTDNFQVPATSLAVANGAATINLTQAQIAAQVHPK